MRKAVSYFLAKGYPKVISIGNSICIYLIFYISRVIIMRVGFPSDPFLDELW
jgi:hypothetical protein